MKVKRAEHRFVSAHVAHVLVVYIAKPNVPDVVIYFGTEHQFSLLIFNR